MRRDSGLLLRSRRQISAFLFDVSLGLLLCWVSALLPDVSRFVKNRGHFPLAVIIVYVLASFIPISGVILGAAHGVEYSACTRLVFGFYATVALFMAQWPANDNNAFASGLALPTFFRLLHEKVKWMPPITRRQATLVPIVMGIVIAALGSWLPTIAGVFIGHFYVVEKISKGKVQSKGIAGLISWIVISLLAQLGKLP